MKALLSAVLIGAFAVLSSPSTSAQRGASYGHSGSISASYFRGGYSSSVFSSSRVWVPGRYETVYQKVFVPGPTRRVWVEPAYEWRIGSCGPRFVCVRAGYWKTVQLPGRYETQRLRVYRPGHWVARSCD